MSEMTASEDRLSTKTRRAVAGSPLRPGMLWGHAYERGEPHPTGELDSLVTLVIDAGDLRRVLGSRVVTFDHFRASRYAVEALWLREGFEIAVVLRMLTDAEPFDE